MKSISVDNNLPLLEARGIAGVIEVRCPAGLSVMTLDDAYALMSNIKRELKKMNYESKDYFEFTSKLDGILSNMTDAELAASLNRINEKEIPWGSDWAPGDTYVLSGGE